MDKLYIDGREICSVQIDGRLVYEEVHNEYNSESEGNDEKV